MLDPSGVTRATDAARLSGACVAAPSTSGAVFAMIVEDRLVVTLPRHRLAGLVDAGDGERIDPGPGGPMEGWGAVEPAADHEGRSLATGALASVGGMR